ncbi:MAG: anaerobic ribonucleoside-triphosphate reductase activating protein [Treponema sp.]|nr:anaerobic ribonucleoside-triphosphate reductase activating protein [Treponema sp.]
MASIPDCRLVLRKTSLIDFPGLISAVLFFSGCNLRCPWCHNRELVLGNNVNDDYISLELALTHIEKRRNVLGGVVLSGGEPALFPDLGLLITRIKSFGLKVKLDTNGLLPGVLESLICSEKTRPDYIAMDLKTSPDRYRELLPVNSVYSVVNGEKTNNPGEAIKRSITLIRSSGINHEFRSLTLPSPPDNKQKPFFDENDKAVLATLVGSSQWNIRPFVPGNCVDPSWDAL